MRNIGMLQGVRVGTPQQYDIGCTMKNVAERSWETSFFRTPSTQPRWLYTTHLDGNVQADTKNHGRPDQAVLLYATVHYPVWQVELGQQEIGPGGFGENFTGDGLSEETAGIGGIYALGEARIQVSGPRYPCWKSERRWHSTVLTARVAGNERTG